MSSAAAGWMIASIATAAVKNITENVGGYGEARRLESVAKYNARVTEERIKALNYEESMNKTLRRLNAYSEIASGKNMMAGRGNVGTSADSAIINAYLNLAGDLSAMTFNYENRRVDLKTDKNNFLYQAKAAKSQKKQAIIGGLLGFGGVTAQGVAQGYTSGVFGSSGSRPNVMGANNG